jgi:4-hydroxybenzoate polyprenyltransferase
VPRLANPLTWRDIRAVHRLEFPFPVNYLCYATWGACFAAGDVARLRDPAVLAVIGANLLLMLSGLAFNTVVDAHTDERHREKRRLARAARRFGTDRLARWAAAEVAVGLLLACLAAVWAARLLLAVTAVAIVVAHLLYNAEPVRLKRHGLAGVAVFCVGGLVLPFLLSYWAVRPDVDATSWLLVAGLGTQSVGRMTSWSVPDRGPDSATGLRTPSVRHGVTGALVHSTVLLLAGLALTGVALWWRFGPLWTVPLVVLQGAVLYDSVGQLRGADVTVRRIRRRVMSPAMLGTVALTITPLVA